MLFEIAFLDILEINGESRVSDFSIHLICLSATERNFFLLQYSALLGSPVWIIAQKL